MKEIFKVFEKEKEVLKKLMLIRLSDRQYEDNPFLNIKVDNINGFVVFLKYMKLYFEELEFFYKKEELRVKQEEAIYLLLSRIWCFLEALNLENKIIEKAKEDNDFWEENLKENRKIEEDRFFNNMGLKISLMLQYIEYHQKSPVSYFVEMVKALSFYKKIKR